jgi:outer membrane protein
MQTGAAACACAMLIALCPAPGGARADEPREITLKDAIATALRSNVDLAQAASTVDSRRVGVTQNEADFLPNLGVSARSGRSYSRTFDQTTNGFQGFYANSLSLGASSSLDLFTGFGKIASLRQSRLSLDAQRKSYAQTRQDVVFSVITSFAQAAVNNQVIKVNEENLAGQKRLLEQIQAFYDAGRNSVADLYQQQAATADAERQLLLARRNYQVSLFQLLQVMGIDPGTESRIVEPDVESIIAEASGLNVGDALQEALARRYDLLSQQKQIEAARTQITVSRSGYWPTLSLSANAGTSYSSTLSDQFDFSEQLKDANPNASIGLSFSLPLFDRLATRSAVQQSKIQLRQTQIAADRLKLQIGVEIRQALEDYAEAQKEVEVSAAQLKYSQQALKSIEARYTVKASTLLEVIQARSAYYQAEYQSINSRYNLLLKGISIAYFRGDIDGITSLFK